jgi:uncharacterized protein YciU (UPF0263 family)
MKSVFLFLSISISFATLHAYEGCAKTKQDALNELSGSIVTTVKSDVEISTQSNSNDESIEERISSISKSSTHLSLVNINFEKRDGLICASIDPKDQVKNTHDLVQAALEVDAANLPENIDKKIEKLSEWLSKVEEANYLLAVFYKPTEKELSKVDAQKKLDAKEKELQDIYDNSIAKANSLVFRACASSKEDAFEDLNEKLFADKTKKKDDEGFFSKAGSFFSSLGSVFSSKDEGKMLDMFSKELIYKKDDKKQCAIIKKETLKHAADNLLGDVKRFNTNSLDKDPKKKYDEILNYQEHLNVTKALLEVFPDKYTKADFGVITDKKQKLANILKDTNPQYVLFTLSGASNIKVTLDDKPAKINEKIYLKTGEHTYKITADGKCPIVKSFEVELKDDTEVTEDLSEYNYPTVLFATDKTPNISVNGRSVKANVAETIKQCEGSVRYIANYSGQSKSGEIELSVNAKETVELKFLTPKELAVFNDAATKRFETTANEKMSQSLTSVSSPALKFSVEDDAQHGKVELHEAGSFTYTPAKDFVGRDSFSYTIEANGEDSAPKIVNIIIKNSNAPVAVAKKIAQDLNETLESAKENVEEKVEEVKEELSKERVDKFQAYLEKLAEEGDIEKMKKVQAKYPDLFEAVLQRKLNP